MKKNTLYMLLLLTSTALSISAMTVVGPHYPDHSQWHKENRDNTELHDAKTEKTPLIVHETKGSKCVVGVMCGVLVLIFVGLGLIFPIVYCGQPGNCSNSTIL